MVYFSSGYRGFKRNLLISMSVAVRTPSPGSRPRSSLIISQISPNPQIDPIPRPVGVSFSIR